MSDANVLLGKLPGKNACYIICELPDRSQSHLWAALVPNAMMLHLEHHHTLLQASCISALLVVCTPATPRQLRSM